MIKYTSTRNSKITINSSLAILKGQSDEGGLFVPSNLNDIRTDYKRIIGGNFFEIATKVWNIFFPDFSDEIIEKLVNCSYIKKFSSDKITPLVKVGDFYVTELYHGPTSAFKDVALSALPNLLQAAMKINDFNDEILILTATSGDTGSAAIEGFSDVPGTSIIVFYPDGGISETQRLQMVTANGNNVSACAIRGNFDDAQRGVKTIFQEIKHPAEGVSLSSANSINIGRLVPQIVYYFSSYSQLISNGYIKDGDLINFVVPTGNFGNIMAGYFAKMMGLPINRLICASNKNDVLTEFLETGRYDSKREFYKTSSPSMDILISSNLERLLYYICGEEHTVEYMNSLAETGEYQITTEELEKIKQIFVGISSSDKEGFDAIKYAHDEYHYLMDTHTAIAWSCLEKYLEKEQIYNDTAVASVILSTASPYKFCRSVLTALGEDIDISDETNMQKCRDLTGSEIPENLSSVFGKPIFHRDTIDVSDMKNYVIEKAVH